MSDVDIDMIEACEDALDKWGLGTQTRLIVGEIGELLALFGRQEQGRVTAWDWCDEIADVQIMLEQLRIVVGLSHDEVRMRRREKVARLRKMLNETARR